MVPCDLHLMVLVQLFLPSGIVQGFGSPQISPVGLGLTVTVTLAVTASVPVQAGLLAVIV